MTKQTKGVGAESMNPLIWWQSWSAELAYVLGFAFADGGIGRGRNSLTIAQKDRAILDKIASIAPGGEITKPRTHPTWRLRFCEPNLRRILEGYGIVPNKTEYGYWPLDMPEKFTRDYVRGFFDGDGYVGLTQRKGGHTAVARMMFVCHLRSYLEQLAGHLHRSGAGFSNVLKDGRNYRLRYQNKADLLFLYDYLYDGATLYMDRKRIAFEEVVEYVSVNRRAGSSHHNSKLTESDVRAMRWFRECCESSLVELAEQFNCGVSTVSGITTYRTWRHVK